MAEAMMIADCSAKMDQRLGRTVTADTAPCKKKNARPSPTQWSHQWEVPHDDDDDDDC